MKPNEHSQISTEPTKADVSKFADRVKKKIEDQGISVNKLTDKLGWGTGLLNKLLQGKRNVKRQHILDIARELKCGPDELVVDTSFAFLLQSIEPVGEQKKISGLSAKVDELQNIIEGFKLQEKEIRVSYERLERENQKLRIDFQKKDLEESNFKTTMEENIRLKFEADKLRSEVKKQTLIAQGEHRNAVSFKQAYENQRVWIEQLSTALQQAHEAGNWKAVIAGFGGLFLGSMASNDKKSKVSPVPR
jgi:transcriptional regulator with XRE-family HTH domain